MRKITAAILFALWGMAAVPAPENSMLGANATKLIKQVPYSLPDGIVAVEYLGLTGTQWIETGVEYSDSTRISITYSHFKEGGTYQYLSVVRLMSGEQQGYFGIVFRDWSSFSLQCWKGDGKAIFPNGFGSVRTITMDSEFATLFDEYENELATIDISSETLPTPHSGLTFPLGGIRTYSYKISSVSYLPHCRIHRAQYFDNDRCVRDLIPVQLEIGGTTVGAMYDLMSGKILENQGTGVFEIGPYKEF